MAIAANTIKLATVVRILKCLIISAHSLKIWHTSLRTLSSTFLLMREPQSLLPNRVETGKRENWFDAIMSAFGCGRSGSGDPVQTESRTERTQRSGDRGPCRSCEKGSTKRTRLRG